MNEALDSLNAGEYASRTSTSRETLMLSALHTPRPQPTVLVSTALPGCGSAAERSVRDREVVSSILTTPTTKAVLASETTGFAGLGTNSIATVAMDRANKRAEATS